MFDLVPANPGVAFVITNYLSRKALVHRFGNLLEESQILLDSENVLIVEDLVSIYPIILWLKDSKIERSEVVSPDNSYSLDDLKIELGI